MYRKKKHGIFRVWCYLTFRHPLGVLECTPKDKGGLLYVRETCTGEEGKGEGGKWCWGGPSVGSVREDHPDRETVA